MQACTLAPMRACTLAPMHAGTLARMWHACTHARWHAGTLARMYAGTHAGSHVRHHLLLLTPDRGGAPRRIGPVVLPGTLAQRRRHHSRGYGRQTSTRQAGYGTFPPSIPPNNCLSTLVQLILPSFNLSPLTKCTCQTGLRPPAPLTAARSFWATRQSGA